MKKLLSTLLLAVAVPATALAIPAHFEMPKQVVKSDEFRKPAFVKADVSINPEILMKSEDRNVMGYDTLIKRIRFYFSGVTQDVSLIKYDPISDNVLIANTADYLFTDTEKRGRIFIHPYSNSGVTRGDKFIIAQPLDTILTNASFDFVSVDPANKDPKKLNYFVFNSDYYPGPTYNRETGGVFSMYAPKGNGTVFSTTVVENGPAGTPEYDWRDLQPLGYTKDGSTYYVAGNSLFADTNSTKPSGKYGMVVFENSNDHEAYYSDFPSAFDLGRYFKEPEKPGSMFSSPMFLGKDSEGTIYAFVNNFMATDLNIRVPAVKKSTDGGMNWSTDFDVMPWKVVTDFVEQYTDGIPAGDMTTLSFAPYQNTDFIVTGKDSYSYVAKLIAYRATDRNYFVNHLVEIYKENGVWGARAISDLRLPVEDGKFGARDIWITYAGTINGVADQLVVDGHTKANEAQLAVTKDGQYLVCKWIENKYTIDADGYKDLETYADTTKSATFWIDSDGEGNYVEQTWNFTVPTGIYLRYRKLGEPNSDWSDVVRITKEDDSKVHLNTFMPKIVPDLEHIPILTSTTFPIPASVIGVEDYEDLTKYNDLAPNFQDMMLYNCRSVLYGVYNIGKVDVKDAETTKDAISVFPNPANGDFNVKFDAAADASVEIFNTLGEKVMDVIGNTANTSTLSNGIYLIKVTSNGKVSSTLFTVAK